MDLLAIIIGLLLATVVAVSVVTVSAAAHATIVTFDDAKGNSILDQNQSSFTDQGLAFTNSGSFM